MACYSALVLRGSRRLGGGYWRATRVATLQPPSWRFLHGLTHRERPGRDKRESLLAELEQVLQEGAKEPYGSMTRGHAAVLEYLLHHKKRPPKIRTKTISPSRLQREFHSILYSSHALKIADRRKLDDVHDAILVKRFLPKGDGADPKIQKMVVSDAKSIFRDLWYYGRSVTLELYQHMHNEWLKETQPGVLLAEQAIQDEAAKLVTGGSVQPENVSPGEESSQQR